MKHEAWIIALGLLAVAVLAAVDHAVGDDLGLSLFYAVPVFLVARRAGLLPGAGVAAAATIGWAVANAQADAARAGWVQYWNVATRLGYFAMTVAAARMRSGLEVEAERARRDALTGLLNRRGFLEAARLEVERSRRFGRLLTVAYLDCDDFKLVNDTHGHEAGDHLLRTAAAVMGDSLRALDLSARVGGDEFVLLLPETEADEARETLDRLVGKLRSELGAHGWVVTFSIGAVTFARPPRSVEAILAAADRVMYRAKQLGKARVEHDTAAPDDVSDPMDTSVNAAITASRPSHGSNRDT